MLEFTAHTNILFVSVSEAAAARINELLQKEGFSPVAYVGSVNEAKRILIEGDVDLIIINAPLPDEDGVLFAIDLARSKSFDFSIIMLTKAELYEKNLYQAERMGIVTLKKPMEPHLLMQTIRLLLAFQVKIRKLERKADKLQQKLEDDRLVNRAKLLLIEQLKMSEQDAHYYIEKKAMDACIKKTKVADEIIRTYEYKS